MATTTETGSRFARRTPARSSAASPKAGADGRTARAVDAAARALASPLPAHKRAEILVKVAALLARAARGHGAARSPPRRASRSRRRASRRRARCRRTRSRPSRRASSPARWCRWTPRRPARASSRSRCACRAGSSARSRRSTSRCNLVAHKLAPALAAGCPVVLKPATATPLSALLLAELEQEAGLPAGWLNVVVGPSSEIGDVLVEDERVEAITFTGSGDVGWGSTSARRASTSHWSSATRHP